MMRNAGFGIPTPAPTGDPALTGDIVIVGNSDFDLWQLLAQRGHKRHRSTMSSFGPAGNARLQTTIRRLAAEEISYILQCLRQRGDLAPCNESIVALQYFLNRVFRGSRAMDRHSWPRYLTIPSTSPRRKHTRSRIGLSIEFGLCGNRFWTSSHRSLGLPTGIRAGLAGRGCN